MSGLHRTAALIAMASMMVPAPLPRPPVAMLDKAYRQKPADPAKKAARKRQKRARAITRKARP